MPSARALDALLMHRLHQAGIHATIEQARILRRAQLTLHRWSEECCGNSGPHSSWCIERDEHTGQPYRCVYFNDHRPMQRHLLSDREAGALSRVRSVCSALGCHYYYQTDPRGCSLYVSPTTLTSSNYTRGIPCIAD